MEAESNAIKRSLTNIVLVIIAVLSVLLLWQLRSLVVVLMISIVLASALAPIANRADQFNIPRWLAVVLVYLGLITLLVGTGFFIGPTVVDQIQILIKKLPAYLEVLRAIAQNLVIRFGMDEPAFLAQINALFDLQALTSWLFKSSQELLIRSYGVTRGIIGGAFTVILSVLLSGYMLSSSQKLINGLTSLFPAPWNQRLADQVETVAQRMGGYIQGRVLVSAILGVVITIGLKLLGISELALGLGVIAGFTNLIPFFGPILGAIPALIVAVAQGGLTFFWVFLLFVVIQNVETYVLDPLLVGSSVKVSPLYQLLAVLGGAQILGIIGALILPPWIAGASVLLENLYLKPKLLAEAGATLITHTDDLTGPPSQTDSVTS